MLVNEGKGEEDNINVYTNMEITHLGGRDQWYTKDNDKGWK